MRINIFAGSGAGKSATASGIHNALCKNYKIELVNEYIKSWAYQKRVPQSFDQCYIFGKQIHAEDSFLQAGVDHVVTDSPVLMQVFYARKHGFPCWQSLLEIATAFEAAFPSINIFLDRSGIPFKEEGRYETESQAKANDVAMRTFMESYVAEYKMLRTLDLDKIIEYVDKSIGGEPVAPKQLGLVDRMLKKFFK